MRGYSEQQFEPEQVFLLGKSGLRMGFVSLEREWHEAPAEPAVARYIKAVEATGPYFERIDTQTGLLRIPSFSNDQKPAIDSVIAAHLAPILQTPVQPVAQQTHPQDERGREGHSARHAMILKLKFDAIQ